MRMLDRYWVGLFIDFIIELVLMRSDKLLGGLIRGCGLLENQRLEWLFFMFVCVEVIYVINEFVGVVYIISEQYKVVGNFRMERDKKDIVSMLRFLKGRDFFGELLLLRIIDIGVIVDSKVNVDSLKEVGERIIELMSG